VGCYSEHYNNAIVTAVTGAPTDSKFGRDWFYRGVRGLQDFLERLWHGKRCYYVGEWHFHPEDEPNPSRIDVNQMMRIARSCTYHCPEPILVIVGTDSEKRPSADCIRVYIFTNSGRISQLYREQ
jgi:hypothetical protein